MGKKGYRNIPLPRGSGYTRLVEDEMAAQADPIERGLRNCYRARRSIKDTMVEIAQGVFKVEKASEKTKEIKDIERQLTNARKQANGKRKRGW